MEVEIHGENFMIQKPVRLITTQQRGNKIVKN